MVTRTARVDDDDDLYDPRYPGKKVVRDGGKVHVPITLTDGMPDWMQAPRRAVFDARHHRPRFADLTDARLQDGLKQAAEARSEWIKGLQDAWRAPTGGALGLPVTTAPPAAEPADDDDLSPRDAYIKRISSAWKTGNGNGASADNIAGLTRSWLSPGARPGPGPGYSDARPAVSQETATKDAADAYAEYVDRITNAWRR
jgi:hypothetical protein